MQGAHLVREARLVADEAGVAGQRQAACHHQGRGAAGAAVGLLEPHADPESDREPERACALAVSSA